MSGKDGNFERLESTDSDRGTEFTGGGSLTPVAPWSLGIVLTTCCLNNLGQISLDAVSENCLLSERRAPVDRESKSKYARHSVLNQGRICPIDDCKRLVLEFECAQSDGVRSHLPTRKGPAA